MGELTSCRKSGFIDCLNVIAAEMSIVCTEALEIEIVVLAGKVDRWKGLARRLFGNLPLWVMDAAEIVFQVAEHCEQTRKGRRDEDTTANSSNVVATFWCRLSKSC